jgi:putative copper resistance protein D
VSHPHWLAVAPAAAVAGLESAGRATTVGLWAARLADSAALTATLGLLLVPAVLLARGGGWAEPLDGAGARAARAAAVTALGWVAASAVLYTFALSNAAARPFGDVLQPALLTRFAGTRFGTAVLVQGWTALAVSALAVGARTRGGALVALGGAALGALAPGWWGHGATSEAPAVAVAVHGLHVLAAAVWVGGLGALTVVLAADETFERLADAARRFSRVAGWAIGVVGVSGLVNALLRIGAPGNLVGTGWGRLVLVKAALFGGIAMLGARQRSRSLPRLAAGDAGPGARAGFRRLALGELALMGAAFASAAAMASGLPADAEAASRIQSLALGFGDGQLNLSVDPAVAGDNVVHLYIFDAAGLLRPVEDVSVTLQGAGLPQAVPLVPAGPGHFTAPQFTIGEPGVYRVRIRGVLDSGPSTAAGTVVVR